MTRCPERSRHGRPSARELDLWRLKEITAYVCVDDLQTDLHLSRSQIETMLCAVVERHLTKPERVALAAKSSFNFDVDQARSDDKRALWTYTLLDAQGATAAVRPEDRIRMAADGLSEADIEAAQDHLAMLRINETGLVVLRLIKTCWRFR
jgi:hypothetical protein